MLYNMIYDTNVIRYSPEDVTFHMSYNNMAWKWIPKTARIELNDGKVLYFHKAICSAEYKHTGVADGVSAVYSSFRNDEGQIIPITAVTFVWCSAASCELIFEINITGDESGQIARIVWPAPLEFNVPKNQGYTVLPRMQGALFPAGYGYNNPAGRIQERDGYMSFFGQVFSPVTESGAGYIAVFDTPWDAYYNFTNDIISPYFVPSMGTARYKRRMKYSFFNNCNYVTICKAYRKHKLYSGEFVTLREKAARNPNINRLIGTPIIHEGIAVHIHELSYYYNKDDPSKNDYFTPFSEIGRYLRSLQERGVKKAYLHLDGWGNHGYDNLHPDVFPPHAEAGGAEGMRELSQTCRDLGYIFGIHDQYRDYYYDGASFSPDNGVIDYGGGRNYCTVWYGGPHTILCPALSPLYVRRNYEEFERLDIKIEGSYLDVFSIVGLDECVSEDHPVTREQCVKLRCNCFDILTAKGIIPSSEETIDSVLPSIALCHHAPYFTSDLGSSSAVPVGIHVPLFNLVYHDCVVIPWFGGKNSRGGWGIPGCDNGYMHALLNGGTIYYSIAASKEDIEYGTDALTLQSRVAFSEMLSHEFIEGNLRRQRSLFALPDGKAVCVEVNFDTDEYSIKYQ